MEFDGDLLDLVVGVVGEEDGESRVGFDAALMVSELVVFLSKRPVVQGNDGVFFPVALVHDFTCGPAHLVDAVGDLPARLDLVVCEVVGLETGSLMSEERELAGIQIPQEGHALLDAGVGLDERFGCFTASKRARLTAALNDAPVTQADVARLGASYFFRVVGDDGVALEGCAAVEAVVAV